MRPARALPGADGSGTRPADRRPGHQPAVGRLVGASRGAGRPDRADRPHHRPGPAAGAGLLLRPGEQDFDLANEADRQALYEIVLTEGTAADICRYLNLAELRRLWPTLWLPRHVRAAWGDRLTAAAPR